MCIPMRLTWKGFDNNTLEHFDQIVHFYEILETD
jgi:hypothetical protein